MKHWDEMSSRWHDDYERGRPGYPSDVVVIAGLPRSSTVLELGAGTGKLTRLLVDEFGLVIAVEPDPQMRRRLVQHCPRARVCAGAAEQIAVRDASVDGVFVAEAFHWFVHERALAESARVLRPGAPLVLMWNRPAGKPDPPIAAVEQLLAPYWPDDIQMPLDLDPMSFPHARDWPQAFTNSPFEPLAHRALTNVHVLGREGVVAYFGSMGWIADRPEVELAATLDEIRSRLDADEYRLPFETHVYRTRLPA